MRECGRSTADDVASDKARETSAAAAGERKEAGAEQQCRSVCAAEAGGVGGVGASRYGRMLAVRVMGCDWRHRDSDQVQRQKHSRSLQHDTRHSSHDTLLCC